MRVLVVSHYFWPEEFRVNELVAQLQRRGHHVTVLTGEPNYPSGTVDPAYRESPERFASYHGAEVIRCPVIPRGRTSSRLALNYVSAASSMTAAGMWRLRGQPIDVVFVFQPSPGTVVIPGLVLAALKRRPVMLWILDQWPETLDAVGVVRSPRMLRAIGNVMTWVYDRCARVLVQARPMVASVRAYTGDRVPVDYFPNWVEDAYLGTPAAPAPEVPPFAGGFSVMFAGNIGDAQDFPTVLDAMERLRDRHDIRWLIVGDGRRADWLSGEVKTRGLSDRVHLLGRHPTERMPAFFACADAMLVSLKRELIYERTVPGKLQSYLASGLPVVGALDGAGAEVIEESGAGVCGPAGDGAALADNVRRLAALSSDERQALGQSGAAYARREFDRDTLMDRLEDWFRQAVDETR